jgi:catechol 2,3-dioxygenase-like lactoylglutathione lyase family enzyme
MQRIQLKTGPYGLGSMIHVVHMTDDVPELNRFYEEVFGGLMYMGVDEPTYLPAEDRLAGLLLISDLCIETMAPKMPADPAKPVGKFYTKFGQHLHSVGYKVDDLPGLGNALIGQGVYIGAPGGGRLERIEPETVYFYPSPRDTSGLMVELCHREMRNDPRLLDTWSSQVKFWELSHPLGISRLAYVTLGVKDLDDAVARYVALFGAELVHDGMDDAEGARFQIVQVGDCLLRLAQPLEAGTPLGAHVARWGNLIYGITFKVHDLDAVESWLAKKNVRTSRPGPDLVASDPGDTFGAPYFFSTAAIPNDPFGA